MKVRGALNVALTAFEMKDARREDRSVAYDE